MREQLISSIGYQIHLHSIITSSVKKDPKKIKTPVDIKRGGNHFLHYSQADKKTFFHDSVHLSKQGHAAWDGFHDRTNSLKRRTL
jgi:hypothetical protein